MKGANHKFECQVKRNIIGLGNDHRLRALSRLWIEKSAKHRYCYNFKWMDRPVIQFPQDLLALEEIIWRVKPEIIIETGIARGGSLVFYASLLEMLGGKGRVIGVDIDIRNHNRKAIEKNRFSHRITMVVGSSIEPKVAERIRKLAQGKKTIVCLDSLHTHNHTLRELELYSPLVKKGGYIVVFDTVIQDMPAKFFPDRPWDKGNNPKTAVREFLKTTSRFEIDKDIENKLLITSAPDGYLKCVKD